MRWLVMAACLLVAVAMGCAQYPAATSTPPSMVNTTSSPARVSGSISGHVFEFDGITPISGAAVSYSRMVVPRPYSGYPFGAVTLAAAPQPPFRIVSTAADGGYRIDGLDTGTWYVWAEVWPANINYENIANTRSFEISSSTPNYPDINFLIPAYRQIKAYIYYNDGKTPYQRAGLQAISIDNYKIYTTSENVSEGRYELTVREGRYWIGAVGRTSPSTHIYLPNSDSVEKAEPVPIIGNNNYIFNLVLPEPPPVATPAVISGHVYRADGITPVQQSMVEIFHSNGRLSQRYSTRADGFFTFNAQPGEYILAATPFDGLHVAPRFYPGAENRGGASLITVRASDNMSSVDIKFGPADHQPAPPYDTAKTGSISGSVSFAGRPLLNAWLELFPLNGGRTIAVQTRPNGQYTISDLPPGEYYLQCTYFWVGSVPRFYPESPSMLEAARISVGEGQALHGYDFRLKALP